MLKSKDLLGIRDLEVSEIMSILELAKEMKAKEMKKKAKTMGKVRM